MTRPPESGARRAEPERGFRPGAVLEQLLEDARFGARLLRREPGFAATTVLTLALAIGATTTIFSVVDAVLLQPPPFPEPERLVTLWQTDPGDGGRPVEPAPANFLDWREQAAAFERMAAIEPFSFDFTGDGDPEVFYAWMVTEGFFEALGAGAAYGRTFLPEEFRPGSGVAVLTHGFWQRRFGGDDGILGRTLTLDGRPHTVVGVLPPDFEIGLERGRGERDLYVPKAIAEHETFIRGDGWWPVLARIRPGVTLAAAQAEMDTVAARLAAAHPRTNAGVGARVIPLHTQQVEAVRPALLLLQGGVALVLLVACVNVANLMLARCARRAQEFTIRTAVGGGRGRLLRQLLTESLVLAAAGGAGGVALTAYALDAIVALMPADVPRLAEIAVNGRILGFAAGLVLATAVAFGLAPVRQAFRQDVAGLLRAQRAGASAAQQRLRRLLVAAEVALALVLLVGAGLLLQSFARLVSVDLGFAPGNTAVMQVFAWDRQADGQARANFFRETLRNVRALPGVTAAGAVSSFPLGLADVTIETPFAIPGRPPPPRGEEPSAAISQVTPGYFQALGVPLRAGRRFERRDDAERPRVAVINETLARRHWPERDPLRQRLTVQVSGQAVDAEIVGVVGATRPGGFDSARRPEIFVPHAQGGASGSMTYVVRTAGDPAAGLPAMQDAVRAVDPLQSFYSVATVEQLLSDTLAARRFTTSLLALFALAALTLAGLGIYGVMAVATTQRTHEFGLRLALGARPGAVVGMVVRGALGLAAAGVAVGAVGALWASRFLASLLFDVAPTDLATLAAVSLLLLLVAASAAWIPARRAARVDPLVALRAE